MVDQMFHVILDGAKPNYIKTKQANHDSITDSVHANNNHSNIAVAAILNLANIQMSNLFMSIIRLF